jgi:hypothetical protein
MRSEPEEPSSVPHLQAVAAEVVIAAEAWDRQLPSGETAALATELLLN